MAPKTIYKKKLEPVRFSLLFEAKKTARSANKIHRKLFIGNELIETIKLHEETKAAAIRDLEKFTDITAKNTSSIPLKGKAFFDRKTQEPVLRAKLIKKNASGADGRNKYIMSMRIPNVTYREIPVYAYTDEEVIKTIEHTTVLNFFRNGSKPKRKTKPFRRVVKHGHFLLQVESMGAGDYVARWFINGNHSGHENFDAKSDADATAYARAWVGLQNLTGNVIPPVGPNIIYNQDLGPVEIWVDGVAGEEFDVELYVDGHLYEEFSFEAKTGAEAIKRVTS